MLKLVIFDLDDTLIHLDVPWSVVKKEVLKLARRNGIAADPKEHLIVVSNLICRDSPQLKKEVDRIYRSHEKGSVAKSAFVVFPHMIDLVNALHSKGYKLAIASGNHTDSIREILIRLNMADIFDVLCGRDCVEHNKPSPDQLLLILELLKMTGSKSDAIFIGDTAFDEQAAASAGIRFFRVKKPADEEDAERLRRILL